MKLFLIKTISQIKNATGYSVQGLKTAFHDEFAFRLELLLCIIAVPLALFLGKSAIERAILMSSLFSIFVVELLNSSIENTLNRIGMNWHELTKKGKDLGSAAVFLTMINALLVWAIIIIPHFWE